MTTCIVTALSGRHSMSVDVPGPGHLHTIKMDGHADVAGCCHLLLSFVDWTGDVALPHHCCWVCSGW